MLFLQTVPRVPAWGVADPGVKLVEPVLDHREQVLVIDYLGPPNVLALSRKELLQHVVPVVADGLVALRVAVRIPTLSGAALRAPVALPAPHQPRPHSGRPGAHGGHWYPLRGPSPPVRC